MIAVERPEGREEESKEGRKEGGEEVSTQEGTVNAKAEAGESLADFWNLRVVRAE